MVNQPPSGGHAKHGPWAALVLLAMVRMAATFTTFSQTTDEAMHAGGGLEVLQDHTYQLMILNPPLPRIVMALPQYLAGVRLPQDRDFYVRTHAVFYNQFPYETNLAMARSGNLLFFALAAFCVWLLAKRALDDRAALIAVFLFTTQPIVLGYSALATHEAPGLAGFGVALIAFLAWLERPDWRRASLLGLAFGFSVLCKFSSLPYVPAACAAILIVRWLSTRDMRLLRAIPLTVLVVLVAGAAVVWIGYGFHARPFFEGALGIARLDREGMRSYLFGHWRMQGWWWYFPAAFTLKTTLPFLALFVASFFARDSRRVALEWSAAALAIFLVASRSRLDIGVRYVLPVFIPMTIAAAAAALALFQRRGALRWCTIALLVLHTASSIAAHPDYFPYFNILASSDPSRYLVDSNLDWEQDALRLRSVLRESKIDSVSVRDVSAIDYGALGFPNVARFRTPFDVLHGWVAIGDSYYREGLAAGGWPQLRGRSYRRVGKSIRLYQVP